MARRQQHVLELAQRADWGVSQSHCRWHICKGRPTSVLSIKNNIVWVDFCVLLLLGNAVVKVQNLSSKPDKGRLYTNHIPAHKITSLSSILQVFLNWFIWRRIFNLSQSHSTAKSIGCCSALTSLTHLSYTSLTQSNTPPTWRSYCQPKSGPIITLSIVVTHCENRLASLWSIWGVLTEMTDPGSCWFECRNRKWDTLHPRRQLKGEREREREREREKGTWALIIVVHLTSVEVQSGFHI